MVNVALFLVFFVPFLFVKRYLECSDFGSELVFSVFITDFYSFPLSLTHTHMHTRYSVGAFTSFTDRSRSMSWLNCGSHHVRLPRCLLVQGAGGTTIGLCEMMIKLKMRRKNTHTQQVRANATYKRQ